MGPAPGVKGRCTQRCWDEGQVPLCPWWSVSRVGQCVGSATFDLYLIHDDIWTGCFLLGSSLSQVSPVNMSSQFYHLVSLVCQLKALEVHDQRCCLGKWLCEAMHGKHATQHQHFLLNQHVWSKWSSQKPFETQALPDQLMIADCLCNKHCCSSRLDFVISCCQVVVSWQM